MALAGKAGDAHAQVGPVLFGLAVLMVAAKVGGLLAERWGQPSVLGELIIGVGLGNVLPVLFGSAGIEFVRSDPTLRALAELGVLVLLFDVGLESDLRSFARVGPSAGLVAVIGVVAPFPLGWAAAAWLLPGTSTLTHLFIGATLTATSVGITIRVLKDLGATRSPEGRIIIGAAIIDDVLGLIVLAVVSGMAVAGSAGLSAVAILGILLKATLFLAATIVAGHYVSDPLVRLVARAGQPRLLLVVGLALCFALAFVAELVGLAVIIGAFAAGLALDPYARGLRTEAQAATLSELLAPLSEIFVPLFFVLMGVQVHLASLADPSLLGFGAVLVVCAVVGKLASAFGVVQRRVNALAVAIGMIPRGEVGLIFAGIGAGLSVAGQPILSQGVYSAIVLMVLVTTVLTPMGLRWALRER
jgi:Kef-type K+ transport system membrane component KefB